MVEYLILTETRKGWCSNNALVQEQFANDVVIKRFKSSGEKRFGMLGGLTKTETW